MAENNYVHLLTTTKVSYPSLNSLKRGGLSSKLHVFSVFYNRDINWTLVASLTLGIFSPQCLLSVLWCSFYKKYI